MQGRNPARFNGGYGVPRGFKGGISKFPPNPLGLAERVPSSADDDSPFSKQQQHNQQLQTHLTVAIPEFLPQNTVFPKNRLLHFICFICFMCPVCVGRKKIFGVKATGSNSFHRLRAVPPPSRREVFGVENRRSVECRREIATVRCVCNAGLHHCNGQMHLQPSVAPPSPVGARIARPFISDVITTFRASARRVIGATAKPLYPIDGKAEGLDRRTPQTSLLEGGGPPQRWKEFPPEGAQPHFRTQGL